MVTKPCSNHPASAVRIKAAPELVLATVENGVADMADAIRYYQARSAESARVASWSSL